MAIFYKELRSAATLSESYTGVQATRVYNQVTEAGDCTLDTKPELGDPFSVEHPLAVITNIRTTPYGIEHGRPDVNKNLNQLTCTFSTDPVVNQINGYWAATKYTGGTSVISLSLDSKGSPWKWLRTRSHPTATKPILKRAVFLLEAKGTYSLTIPIPNENTGGRIAWSTYLTGGERHSAETPYGINNALGKINELPVHVSPVDLIGEKFKRGQLLFNSYDTSAAIDINGAKLWMCTLNFAYRVINLNDSDAGINAEYPWLYVLNDIAKQEETSGVLGNRYQLPTTSTENEDDFPKNGNFLYDTVNFATALDFTPL